MDPFCFDIEPDSMVTIDLHIHEGFPRDIITQQDNLDFSLSIVNYPNPFNSVTNFSIVIPQSLQNQKGYIKVYNVSGQEIKNINVSHGSTAQWDGTDQKGVMQPTGVYYYQLLFENRVYKSGSMILLK
jgi:flagellar hook assembly protein FlgD